MSAYPPPHPSNVFNPIDFITEDDDNDTSGNTTNNDTNNNTDEYDHSNLLLKTGGIMSGLLQLPQLKFSDNTIQGTAFLNTDKTQINTNSSNITTNTDNITTNTDNITTNTDNITTNTDDISNNTTNISAVELKTENININTQNVVIQDKTLSLKNSYLKNIVNTIGPYTFFDANLALMRGSSVYRKYWLGMTGNDIDAVDNRFNICVNGNESTPECILDLDHDGNLTVKGNINNPAISTNTTKISEIEEVTNNFSETAIEAIWNMQSKAIMLICKHLKCWCDELLIDNVTNDAKIVLNGEDQHYAYTNVDRDIVQNTTNISNDLNLLEVDVGNNINKIAQNEIDIATNSSRITTNVNSIASHGQAIDSINGQLSNGAIYIIPLDSTQLLGVSQIPNGQSYGYGQHVDIDIGSLLYSTYGAQSDWYASGLWRNYNDWEVSFAGHFHSHNSFIYQMKTGFRNLNDSDGSESPSTANTIDCGMRSSTSGSDFYKEYRYNSGPVIIRAGMGSGYNNVHLYGNYKLFLRTYCDLQTGATGAISLKGVLTMRKL